MGGVSLPLNEMAASIGQRRLPPDDGSISSSGNMDDDPSTGVKAFGSDMG